ncbi:MAG: alpha/beta hydrolase-fold protein, partial [Flavisolibacter sp.]
IFCQDVYHFTKALTIDASSRYGREAVYTDALLYQLYTSNFKSPVVGDSLQVGARNQFVKWVSVSADSSNWFRGRGGYGGGGGYTYFTYNSDKEQVALLNIKGNSAVVANGVFHAGDPYAAGYLYIPVPLKKGLNEFYVRGTNVTADLTFPQKQIILTTEDPTLPYLITGNVNSDLMGAVVIINTSPKELRGLKIKTSVGGKEMVTDLPSITPLTSRKVPFHFDGSAILTKGNYDCQLQLLDNNKILDEKKLTITSVNPTDKYSATFISNIDGSVQYYAVTPQTPAPKAGSALFLSVHGAGVEAIGQAKAYQSKDWGTLVAATNRRPRGFNWEDWGRLDALEVLSIAKEKFQPDPQRIYLTGHSMGGHGTWFLGATYPDKWAAIGACSGYPTLKGYGSADGLIPSISNSPVEQMLLRSGNQSDVIKLVTNYKPLGVYVLHGDADKVVSVSYARQMRKLLGEFHSDFSYYEYPNGEHWFGDQSVDWKPLFDFFKWHTLPVDSAINTIDFITSNPGISSKYHWASIQQQLHPLQYSRMQLKRDPMAKTITGSTENIRLMKLQMNDFKVGDTVSITLDGSQNFYQVNGSSPEVFLFKNTDKWTVVQKPGLNQKGPHRYGTFKDAFNNRMVFVFSTKGTKAENEWSLNKARYDAETWYYRGNGAVDIVADKDFALEKYKDRGVILYGNKTTNTAWKALLTDCPIQIERNKITAANKTWQGDDFGAYFVWPIHNSNIASVAVISGTGITGMQAANANQYFAGASGFPDFMIFRMNMLLSGSGEIKMAGFFDNDWKLSEEDYVQTN